MKMTILFRPLMYLDPGSGSFIIQMLLAGLLGAAVAIRIYWKKIVAFFNKKKGGEVIDDLDELDEYGGEIKDESEED
jgi:hypothetical protein